MSSSLKISLQGRFSYLVQRKIYWKTLGFASAFATNIWLTTAIFLLMQSTFFSKPMPRVPATFWFWFCLATLLLFITFYIIATTIEYLIGNNAFSLKYAELTIDSYREGIYCFNFINLLIYAPFKYALHISSKHRHKNISLP